MGSNNHKKIVEYPKHMHKALNHAVAFQQDMYELSGDWNYYDESEYEHLKKNIRFAIYGAYDIDPEDSGSHQNRWESDSESQNKLVDFIFGKILEASRTKKSLYVGTIFNAVCNTDEEKDHYYSQSIPVFKVKRCEHEQKSVPTIHTAIGETAVYSYCVHYVDSEGRIYENWHDYLTHNTLPKCMMVLPTSGFYQPDPGASNTSDETFVWLEICHSPLANTVLPVVDTISTAIGTGALGLCIAALITPIAAPLAVAGTIAGVTSGLYTTGRSTHQLVDRGQHCQSISVTDRSARSAWFGVVGGVAGGLASGSSVVLNRAIRAGTTIGTVGRGAHDAIMIGNILVNGAGISNGIYGIYENYLENRKLSGLEVAQVVAHILFFGNAVMKFQTAQTIITDSQQQILKDYETSLRSARHRKAFNRMKRNTEAASGDATSANREIIRGIRSIQNKDDFFAGVVKNRKIFNAANAEVTFKDGYAMINNDVKFDPAALASQPKEVRANVAKSAEPFIPVKKSALPQLSKMSMVTVQNQMTHFEEILKPIIIGVRYATEIYESSWFQRLILELQLFNPENRDQLFLGLAKLAKGIFEEAKESISNSLLERMCYLWLNHVKPRVNNILEARNIDVSTVEKFIIHNDDVYSIAQEVIDEILNHISNILQEIIDACTRRVENMQRNTSNNRCEKCSGFVLIDS